MTTLSEAASSIAIPNADRFFIGGDWVSPSSGATLDVVSSSTEQIVFQVAEAQADDIDRAVAAARDSFDIGPWPQMSHRERGDYLRAIGEQIRQRSDELATIWSAEMGVTYAAAQAMSHAAGDVFDYYAGLGDSFPFVERHTPSAGNVGYLVREPVGVVGAIIPWNAPLTLMTYKVAPALIAGCTLVIKASPEAPGVALIFADIVKSVNLPAGVVNVLTADREVLNCLSAIPAWTRSVSPGPRARDAASLRFSASALRALPWNWAENRRRSSWTIMMSARRPLPYQAWPP